MTKKLRFEIFKRDGFTCQYCGKTPPAAVLEVDHIIPKSSTGTDDINNLTTSCFECNRGKSDNPLSVIPNSLSANLEFLKEKREQARHYHVFLERERVRIENDVDEIGMYFFNKLRKNKSIFADAAASSVRMFLKHFDKLTIKDAIDIAFSRVTRRNAQPMFKYMCGILHNWKKNGITRP